MAVPSSRLKAGRIEIENKERKIREELKLREENQKTEEITAEEHKRRLEMLKEMDILNKEKNGK